MCKYIILCLFLSISIISFSQKKNASKYGKITMQELEMDTYASDTTAPAVILFSEGSTAFVANTEKFWFNWEAVFRMKIKILKEEGLEQCNQAINYFEKANRNKEIVKGLNGATYNLENGKISQTKLSKEYISDESVNSFHKIKKFTMPAAKVGSVIEFEYKMESARFWDIPYFVFQHEIPVCYASYSVEIPEYFIFNTQMYGYEPIKTERKDKAGHYDFHVFTLSPNVTTTTYTATNLPALKDENLVWCASDYLSRVAFELKQVDMKDGRFQKVSVSWNDVDKELLENSLFGGNLKSQNLFKDLDIKKEQTLENARSIQNQIRTKVKWNNIRSLYSTDIKNAYQKGIGHSADLNFLLMSALSSAGFNVIPIAIRTRDLGMILPGTHSAEVFNATLTGIVLNEEIYVTDAADKYSDWNNISPNRMVEKARLITPQRDLHKWLDITTLSKGSTYVNSEIHFKEGELSCLISDSRKGTDAYELRKYYQEKHDNEKEFIDEFLTLKEFTLKEFAIENADKPEEDIKMIYEINKNIEEESDYIYIAPLQLYLFEENPFNTEKRILPINFNYLFNHTQLVTIHIPEGYTIDDLPGSVVYTFDEKNSLSFAYRIAASQEKIVLRYQFMLNRLLFLQDEYAVLKDFLAKVIAKNEEMIVLKKKDMD